MLSYKFSLLVVFLLFPHFISCHTATVKNAEDIIHLFNSMAGSLLKTDIELLANLDFSASNLTLPLGAFSNGRCVAFSGILQGNGHSIKGLVMVNRDNVGYQHAGLFCRLKDIMIENLVIDSSCSFTGYSAGALSVSLGGSLKVSNVTNKASVKDCTMQVGGFIGFIDSLVQQNSQVEFEHCTNDATISGSSRGIGGFLGMVSGSKYMTVTFTD